MKAMQWIVASLATLVIALPASAQPVYKSTMPDGRVIYGPEPVPGARKVDTITPPPASTGVTTLTPGEKAAADALERGKSESDVESEIATARAELKAAEAARDGGKEPLPGERLGTAGGGSRLTDAYFARQKMLEDDVAKARRRLEEAQAKGR